MATDSQFTVDSNKRYAAKIFPIERPDLTILIAGAGNADLIQSAVQGLEYAIQPDTNFTIPEIRVNIEQYLSDFYRDYVYPIPDYKEHSFDLLVGVQTTDDFELFKTTDGRVYPALSHPCGYCTIGYGQGLPEYVIRQFYSDGLISIAEAKFIATSCIEATKKHNQYCGGDTQLWTLTDTAPFRADRVGMLEIADTEEYSKNLFDLLRTMTLNLIDPDIGSNVFDRHDTTIDHDHLDWLTNSLKELILDFRQKQKDRKDRAPKRE